MENEMQKEITERLAELPTDVRQAILSAELDKRVQELGTKHQLHVDQVGILADLTLLTMLGFIDPGVFSKELQGQLHTSPEQAEKIAAGINQEIILPIRESMKKLTEQREKEEAELDSLERENTQKTQGEKLSALPITPADTMLTEKTVSVPPPLPSVALAKEGPAPTPYKTDPYREPPE